MGEVGKGVFSTVLKCLDLRRTVLSDDTESHPPVILKVIRNNDIMRKASEKELALLSLISRADPEGKKHCVRLLSHSDYRNHIVIVFEPLSMNLRETLKKFGKNVGINITAVRMYARQLFVALRHLSDLKIVHADIKPDNIVVSEDLKTVGLVPPLPPSLPSPSLPPPSLPHSSAHLPSGQAL
jgi:serine/threonine-protein kinase PRP4